jgi:hypothetical protein
MIDQFLCKISLHLRPLAKFFQIPAARVPEKTEIRRIHLRVPAEPSEVVIHSRRVQKHR